MDNFFDGLPLDQATELEQLSRLMYELRANRDTVLAQWSVTDAPALLARIRAGELPEHPAYEHYLSACILDETRASVREMLAERLKEAGRE